MSQTNLSRDFITLDQLYLAYRKAKVDVCNDKNQSCSCHFLQYEKQLQTNLIELQSTLTSAGTEWFENPAFIGSCGCVPKTLEYTQKVNDQEKEGSEPHFFISNSDDAWESNFKAEGEKIRVEFRPVAIFTVNMYIISALW